MSSPRGLAGFDPAQAAVAAGRLMLRRLDELAVARRSFAFETWGEAQADRYLDALELGTGKIAEDPTRGESRHELRDGYWSKSIEHHAVDNTFTEAEVRIRRVLHEVMDVGRHL